MQYWLERAYWVLQLEHLPELLAEHYKHLLLHRLRLEIGADEQIAFMLSTVVLLLVAF